MTHEEQKQTRSLTTTSRAAAASLALTIVLGLTVVTTSAAHAQTFTILHNFTNGDDGSQPQSGLVMDGAGNLYGATPYGGDTEDCSGLEAGGGGVPPGCGVVYKVKKAGSGWIVQSLFLFGSSKQTITPYAGIPAIGPGGVLYGMTYLGGFGTFGNIYSLAPAPNAPVSVVAPWNYKLVFQFTSGTDSNNPSRLAPLLFDAQGDIYGAAAGRDRQLRNGLRTDSLRQSVEGKHSVQLHQRHRRFPSLGHHLWQ